ncbi:hypothetical protein GW17_00029926 [Ensete ventricosum]|nr:hypothetical protein GW17_00029926 [Ensete ventricosum]
MKKNKPLERQPIVVKPDGVLAGRKHLRRIEKGEKEEIHGKERRIGGKRSVRNGGGFSTRAGGGGGRVVTSDSWRWIWRGMAPPHTYFTASSEHISISDLRSRLSTLPPRSLLDLK